jgi:hypothetical protein
MVLGFAFLLAAGVTVISRDDGKKVADDPTPCRASAILAPARGFEGAYVAADPKAPDHVVVGDTNVLEGKCAWHTTFNRGKDWSEGVYPLPDGYTGCRINQRSGGHVASGSVAIGPSGRVYSVFGSAYVDTPGRESVMLARSDDGGKTFGPAKVAVAPTAVGADVGLGRPLMTVVAGPSGRDTVLLSFWLCHPSPAGGNACDGAYFARSDDGGDTFAPPVLVNDPPAGQNPSQPAMTSDGTVFETFQRRFSDGPVDILLAKSTDGGKTFTVSKIDTEIQVGVQYDPAKLVVDPRSGAVYTAWSDSRTGRQQIFFQKSMDKGATWAEKAALLAPDPTAAGSSRSPSISVAPSGRIDVVYYHTSPTAPESDDVFWSYSTDGGENFVARQVDEKAVNRKIGYSGPAGSLGQLGNHYPPTVASLDTAAYVVWSDTSDANPITPVQDVVLRRMEVAGAVPP